MARSECEVPHLGWRRAGFAEGIAWLFIRRDRACPVAIVNYYGFRAWDTVAFCLYDPRNVACFVEGEAGFNFRTFRSERLNPGMFIRLFKNPLASINVDLHDARPNRRLGSCKGKRE